MEARAMSDPVAPTQTPAPAFKRGDKVTITATVAQANGDNWILTLPTGAHCILATDQITKQP